jgi:hypothetical protein
MESVFAQIDANCRDKVVSCIVAHEMFSSCFAVIRTCYFAPRGARPVHPITLKIPYGNKEVALKLGARYPTPKRRHCFRIVVNTRYGYEIEMSNLSPLIAKYIADTNTSEHIFRWRTPTRIAHYIQNRLIMEFRYNLVCSGSKPDTSTVLLFGSQ